jgi:hypothetical protein
LQERQREAAEASLRERGAALAGLLEGSSNHWGYEDPVYRFYHQSFNVYSLQGQTESIAAALADLAPDRPLNPGGFWRSPGWGRATSLLPNTTPVGRR